MAQFYKKEQREYHGPPCPWVKRVTIRTFITFKIKTKPDAVGRTHPHTIIQIDNHNG